MKQIRLGIIGTGVAARLLHWQALQQMPERYRIVAVANRSRKKGEAFADLVGLEREAVCADYRDLLARGDLDAVLLTLPTNLNYEVARAAAEAGIDVICEKPIAPGLEQGQAMLRLPERFGVKLLIAENFRYDAAVQKARELIDSGRVQAPFMLSYQYVQPVPLDDEIANTGWRQADDYTGSGGFLIDHGVHMIDVVRYLMGEIAALQVFAANRRAHVSGFDTAVYNLKFASGTLGSIQWSFCVASEQVSLIRLWSDDDTITIGVDEVRLQRQGAADEVFRCPPYRSFLNEWIDFYAALVHGRTPIMTPHDAWKDLQAALAANRSAVAGDIIAVDAEI